MFDRDGLATGACVLLLCACGDLGGAAEDAQLEPVRQTRPAQCDGGERRFGDACVDDVGEELIDDDGAPVSFRLHQADGRWWWFSMDRVIYPEAVSLCERLGGTVFLPRTLRDWGVAMHFAAIADAVYDDRSTPWIGMRTNLRTSVVEAAEDGRALFVFRADLPPLPAAPNESVTDRLVAAIEAVALGEEPNPEHGCFRADYDGSVRTSLCTYRGASRTVLCGPRSSP